MVVNRRSLWAELTKMALSAGWIVTVTLIAQNYATGRLRAKPTPEHTNHAIAIQKRVATFRDGLDGNTNPRLIAAGYTAQLDDRVLDEMRDRDGVLEVTPEPSNDVLQAVDFLDSAVNKVGVDHVGISASLYERAGYDITLELLARGYCEEDILKLLGGNAERVLNGPDPRDSALLRHTLK